MSIGEPLKKLRESKL